jgi:phospholipase/lecithinase/hemolysin/uncharacterized protein YhjY with autotransporter beta-barrel domain
MAQGGGRCAKRGAAVLVAAIVVSGGTPARAQTQFTSITDFGDSYADTGYAPGGAFQMRGVPCPGASVLPCRFTGSTNFVDSLQAIYLLPTATNYAIGGARTDGTNSVTFPGPPLPGLTYELQQFALSGARFSDRDLVVLSIGGNDASLLASTYTVAQTAARATHSAANAIAGVAQLTAAGAKNIAWLSPGNEKYFPEPPKGSDALALTTAQHDTFAHTYFQALEASLAPYARAGVRVFLFDFETLQARLAADPTRYGFASATNCEAGPGTASTPGSVRVNVAGCFYENSVHPTGAGMDLIARYMANQIDAPTTVVPQGGIVTGLATGFAGSVLGRLDAERSFSPFGFGGAYAMAGATPARPEGDWSIISSVDTGGGSRDRQFAAAGYDYDSVGGSVAVEYRGARRWRLGGVFGYGKPDIDYGVQNAHNRIDAYQFAGYASFTAADWFADGLVAYGRHDISLDRRGVIDAIRGDTAADTFAAAVSGGHLTDVGTFRIGPVARLTYVHAVIHGYTESGDDLLTMMVDRQTLDELTGSAGVQVRSPFVFGNGTYSPFVSVTAEHRLLGSGRVVTTTQVTTPLLPVLTSVPDEDRTYGRVAAGVAATIAKNVNATLTATTSFAREGGNDGGVSAGIRVAFQ